MPYTALGTEIWEVILVERTRGLTESFIEISTVFIAEQGRGRHFRRDE